MMRAAKILLVEDSATQALQIRYALEQAGFEVECVSAAESALESLNRNVPDLLVTDYRLPGIPGDELCRKIRMNVATRGIPILMLTSEEGSETERHVLESGADDYVPKSADLEFVLLRVQTLLKKSHVREVLRLGDAQFAAAKLLVVDDSPTYLQLLRGELEKEGHEVRTAASGAEALERLALEPFDGVVLDLALPDMSGAEVCRRLAESRRTPAQACVVLALTASATRDDITSILAAGADDVVAKQRDFEVIKARLRALIRRQRLHEENQRIAEEFRRKEREVLRAHAQKEAAEVRAAMAGELERANRGLEAANRELKQAQAQLVQQAKMASLGQLVAGIAHEINNPLAYVMNHQATAARLLQELATAAEPRLEGPRLARWSKARQRLGEMQQGLERIKDLVLKLRTFSRLDEGERKYVKIEESIESVLTLLHHRTKDRIKVIRSYGDVKVVPCYPGPLNQVLMNLVSNAIDAIEDEGEITIRTGTSDSMFFVSVADTGKGMPEAVRERIFEPFFTTKPVGEGTGLGLAISYGIVQRHKGTLEARSEAGKGTEMIVRLPLRPEEGGAP